MAEHYSTGMPEQKFTTAQKSFDAGNLNVQFCEYVFKGTEVANDLINIMTLPAGAKFIPALSYINGDQPTVTATIEGYCSAGAISGYRALAASATAIDFAKVTTNTVLKAKISATPTVNKKVFFAIVYSQTV